MGEADGSDTQSNAERLPSRLARPFLLLVPLVGCHLFVPARLGAHAALFVRLLRVVDLVLLRRLRVAVLLRVATFFSIHGTVVPMSQTV
jgi:hypothetical protein